MSRQINDADPNVFGDGYKPQRESPPVEVIGGVLDEADLGGVTKHSGATNHDAGAGTYDMSVTADQLLNTYFSEDNGASYKKVSIDGLVGATPAATTAAELAALLAANAVFDKYIAASDNGGTLRLNARMPSSRFKMYFTGAAAAKLAGVFTTAVAPGSAVGGADQAGGAFEFTVQDQEGNVLSNKKVFLSALDASGVVIATTALGLMSLGQLLDTEAGGNDGVEMLSDADGKVSGYVADTAAEDVYVTARVGSNTAALAVLSQGQKKVTFV